MAIIDQFLAEVVSKSGSDLHFVTGARPMIRINGNLQYLRDDAISLNEGQMILMEILSKTNRKHFVENLDLDFAYHLQEVSRFRVTMFHQSNGIGAVFRVIPDNPFSLEDLGLPPAIAEFANMDRGLVLVTGATGSGKSTTLASIIDIINKRGKKHIITIEDPIEFVHHNKGCLITQREVGLHTEGFAKALRAALREDPDIIMVGEMRDLETTHLTLSAAETGILVFATVHTNSAVKTIDRVVDVFPVEEQEHVRVMLSVSLKGVISQQLLQISNGTGRVPAVELMFCNPAISNVLREGKTHQLTSLIQGSRKEGMQTMDQSLIQLFRSHQISYETALSRVTERGSFLRSIQRKAG
ncbi:type IV pilus twitching motility protein PilT [bacterium]|nr:type IV pilus twitching motility protein PilT [candidate division CSSED10-310 bacterium]